MRINFALFFDRLFMILLPILIIVLMVIGVQKIMGTMKPPETVEKPIAIAAVEVMLSTAAVYQVEVPVEGNVVPKWEASIATQVGGKVLSVSDDFQAGRRVTKGQALISIERADFEVALAQAEAAVVTAMQGLREEEAKGTRAAREWTRSGRRVQDASDLSLRKPQLAGARAAVRSAEAEVARVRLDLDRTTVYAPFDGVIEERMVSPGDVSSPGQVVGKMLGSETFEVRLSVSPARAAELDLGQLQNGPIPLDLESGLVENGPRWPAKITRIDSRLDSMNRFVHLIAEVEDPLGDPNKLLPAGSFVSGWIKGREVPDAHLVPETSVVRDQLVWTLDENDRLKGEAVRRVFSKRGWSVVLFLEDPLAVRQVVPAPVPSFRDGQEVKRK